MFIGFDSLLLIKILYILKRYKFIIIS